LFWDLLVLVFPGVWDVSLGHWFGIFLIYALMAINFLLRTAFALSHRFRWSLIIAVYLHYCYCIMELKSVFLILLCFFPLVQDCSIYKKKTIFPIN
jgi:hypothetical protein